MAETSHGGAAVAEPVAARKAPSQAQGPEPEAGLTGLTPPLGSRSLAWDPPVDPTALSPSRLPRNSALRTETPARNSLRVGPVTLTGEWTSEQIVPVVRSLGELLPKLGMGGHPFELKIVSASEVLAQRRARGSGGNGKVELYADEALRESARQRYLIAHEAAHVAQQRRKNPWTETEDTVFAAELEAHEIATAFASYSRISEPLVSAPAALTLFDNGLDMSLKEQVARSRATEIEYIKKQLKGWVSSGDVHRTLLVLQSVDFFVARAIMQNVEPKMRRKLVDHLDGNDAKRFRTEVFAAYTAMETDEVRHFGADLFDKVDLHELTPHEHYAARYVLEKLEKKGEELRGTKNEFAIAVILADKLTNEAISDEQLQKALDQEQQAGKKGSADASQALSAKEQADYSKVASLLAKRFFFFPPSQSKVREALQLLSTYLPHPDRMRLLALKLDKAELLDRLVEHAPVKALVQEQRTESAADGKTGPVLLPTFLTLVSFRPAYRNVALAEDLSRQTFFRKWISNIGSEQAFLALQLLKSVPDRMKESFAADSDEFLTAIRDQLDPEESESESVNAYGGGLHQQDRAKIEAALLDEALWSKARLSELNARIRMANAANDRRFVFDQSAKFRAWQLDGLLPLVEKYSLYNPEATGPDGKRKPRTTFAAPDRPHRKKGPSFLGAAWRSLGHVKVRGNGVEAFDLDVADLQRLSFGALAGIELKNSDDKKSGAPQPNRIQHLILNTDTREFEMDAALIEIASVHRLAVTRIDTGEGTIASIHLKGHLSEKEDLNNVTAAIGSIKLADIMVTMAGSIATIQEVEITDIELRLGAELEPGALPKVEVKDRPYGGRFLSPILSPLVHFFAYIPNALHAKNTVMAMLKVLEDMPQRGLRIGGIKVRGIYLSSGEHVESLSVEGIELRSGATLEAYQAELLAASKALAPQLAKAAGDLKTAGPAELEARQSALLRLQKWMEVLQAEIAAMDGDKATLKDLEVREKTNTLTPAEIDQLQLVRRGGALLSVASAQISGVGGQLSAESITVSDVQGMGRTGSGKTPPVLAGRPGKADFQVTAGCFTAVAAGWKSAPEDSAVLGAQIEKLKSKIAQAAKSGESAAPMQVKLQLLDARLKDTQAYEQYAERGIATLTLQEISQYRLLIENLSETSSVTADKIEAHDLALSASADASATTGGASAKLLTITGVHYRRTESSLQQEEAQLEAVETPTPAQKTRLQDLKGALAELRSLRFRQAENAAAIEKARGTEDEAALREQKTQIDRGIERWGLDQRVAESVTLRGPHVTVSAAGGLVGGDKSFEQLMGEGLHVSGGFEKLEIKNPELQTSAQGVTSGTKATDISAGPFEGTFDVSNTGLSIQNLTLGNLDVTGLDYRSSEQSMKAGGNISLQGLSITKARIVYEDVVGPPDKAAKDPKKAETDAAKDDTSSSGKDSEVKRKATTLHCDEMRIASISGSALAFSKQMDDGQKMLNVKVPHGSLMAIALRNFSLALPSDDSAMQYAGHAEVGNTEIAGLNGKLGKSLEASASIRAGLVSADFVSGGKTTVSLNDINVINAHLHQAGKGGDATDVLFDITHVGGKVVLDADGNISIDLKPTIGVEVKALHWKSGTRELTSNKPVKLESVELHATVHKQPDGSIKDVAIRSMHIPLVTAEALRYQDGPIDLHLDQDLAGKDKKAFSIRDITLHEFIYSPKKGILSGDIVTKDISAAVSGDFFDQIKGGLRLDAKGIAAHFYQDGTFAADVDGLSAKFKGSAYGADMSVNLDGFSAHVHVAENSIVVQNLGLKSLKLDYLNFDSPEFRISLPDGAGHAELKALAADFVILLNPAPKPDSVPPGKEPPSRFQAVSITKLHIDEINAAGLELEIKGKAVPGGKPAASTLVRLPDKQPLMLSGIDIDGTDMVPGAFVIDKKTDGSLNILGGLKVGTAELQQLQVATAKSFQLKTAIHAGGIRLDFLGGSKRRISVSTLSVEDLNVLLGEKSSTDPTQFAMNFTDPGTGITVKIGAAHIEADPLKRGEPPLVVDPDGSASLTQLIIDDAHFNIPDLMQALQSKPADPGKDQTPAPAGPAFDLKDWKFLNTLQGWLSVDLVYETKHWNFKRSLMLNLKDGKFPFHALLDDALGGFGVFGAMELQGNVLAIELDLSALPQPEGSEYNLNPPPTKFNEVEIPLNDEELEQARMGKLPLTAIFNARAVADFKSALSSDGEPKKPSGTPTPVPEGVHINRVDGDLYTAGSSVIDLGAAGKIIIGPDGQTGLSHLRPSGSINPEGSVSGVRRNEIDVALDYANVGIENLQVGGVGLNMGRLSIEGVKDTRLTFDTGMISPKSLSGKITRATARDVKIDFAQLVKKPDAGKDKKP